MSTEFTQAVRQGLANLMAREHLTVVHAASVDTAQFDTKQRILTLPVWHVPDAVYNMLLAHEVGHALYTPSNFIEEAQKLWTAFTPAAHTPLLNMLEDMRIDRAIQRQYPGVRRDYTAALHYMYDKGLLLPPQDTPVDALPFVNRALLHHRVGHLRTIPFTPEERPLLARAMASETFADVIALLREVASLPPPSAPAQTEETPEQTETSEIPQSGDAAPAPAESAQEPTAETAPPAEAAQTPGEASEKTEASAEMGSEAPDTVSDPMQDWLRSQTEAAQIQQEPNAYRVFRARQVSTYLLDTLPELRDYTLLESPLTPITDDSVRRHRDAWVERGLLVWKEAKERAAVMATTFRNHKAAALSSRERQATTGILDMQKLFSHQWSTKLFKQVTLIPKGQSHSMLLLLDWSGSMSSLLLSHEKHTNDPILGPLVRDLLTLVEFCRLCQIPYEVRSWTATQAQQTATQLVEAEHRANTRESLREAFLNGNLQVASLQSFWAPVNSVRIFSSRWSREQHRIALTHLLEWIWAVRLRTDQIYGTKPGLAQGRTPLAEVLALLPTFIKPLQTDHRFVMLLTDGEGTGSFVTWEPTSLTDTAHRLTVSVPPADAQKHAVRKSVGLTGHPANSLLTLLCERARALTGAHLTCYRMGNTWTYQNLWLLRKLQTGTEACNPSREYQLPENYLKQPMPLFIGQAFGFDEYIWLPEELFRYKSNQTLLNRVTRAKVGSKAYSNALVALEVAKKKDRPFLQQLAKMVATRFTTQEMPRG